MKPTHRTHAFPDEPKTLVGYAPPLHLPADYNRIYQPDVENHDTIVVDIEIAPDGQAYIERLP